MIKVIPFIYQDTDDLFANTYLLIDEDKQCVVIDPGKDYPGLVDYINKNALTLKGVLLTHGHIDHMRGVDRLAEAFYIPVFIGFEDEGNLKDSYSNCSDLLGEKRIINSEAQTIADRETLHLIKEDIHVIHTPFHTSGSMCFFLQESGVLFTGDFIIPHSVGRSDLPGAKPREFAKSMAKILALPLETKIYGGHGPSSTLALEQKVNPFVK